MKVIGLAGRPGSGKSAVASALAKRPGVEWIDLDRLAWEVYAPGTAAFRRLIEAFGEGIIGKRGTGVLIVEGALLTSSPHVDRTAYDAVIWLEAPEGVRRRRLKAAGREDHLPRGRGTSPSGSAIVIDARGPIEEVAARVWNAIVKI